jgi:RNA binding activity-knot of a chromodomain
MSETDYTDQAEPNSRSVSQEAAIKAENLMDEVGFPQQNASINGEEESLPSSLEIMNSYTRRPDPLISNADPSKMPVATEGAHLMVLMVKESEFLPAEVLSVKKNADGVYQYYVHWTEFNRRLDEWVGVDRMDLTNINYGAPLRESKLQNASRSSTPDSEVIQRLID